MIIIIIIRNVPLAQFLIRNLGWESMSPTISSSAENDSYRWMIDI